MKKQTTQKTKPTTPKREPERILKAAMPFEEFVQRIVRVKSEEIKQKYFF